MLRRALVFLLVWPALTAVFVALAAFTETFHWRDPEYYFVALLWAYFLGFVPGAVIGAADHAFAHWGLPWRPVYSAGVAYLMGLPIVAWLQFLGAVALALPLLLALPALICAAFSAPRLDTGKVD